MQIDIKMSTTVLSVREATGEAQADYPLGSQT